jgi:hypothetical protein
MNITFDGFDFKLPDKTIHIIQELSTQVGSPTYIKTPIFQKRDKTKDTGSPFRSFGESTSSSRKKKSNKNIEINDNDWESLRSFHATKMEQKMGLDVEIDTIRSFLNKMSDRNYVQMKTNIIEILDKLIQEEISPDEMMRVSATIFDIASNNRFFSKLYADLYSELIEKYQIMKDIFDKNFHSFLELFETVEYVDPEVDYNKYCKINKDNEKRKALSSFFVNLTLNGLLKSSQLLEVVQKMFVSLVELMKEEDNKSQVDEYTENVAILYNKKYFVEEDESQYMVDGKTISEMIKMLSECKVKSYPSLSNKSIFKYMDILDM